MSHLMPCVDAPNCPWADLASPTLAGVNCVKYWEESMTEYRGLDEEEVPINAIYKNVISFYTT